MPVARNALSQLPNNLEDELDLLASHIAAKLRPRSILEISTHSDALTKKLMQHRMNALHLDYSEWVKDNGKIQNSDADAAQSSYQKRLGQHIDLVILREIPETTSESQMVSLLKTISPLADEILWIPTESVGPLSVENALISHPWGKIMEKFSFSPIPAINVTCAKSSAVLLRKKNSLRITLVCNTSSLHGGIQVIYRHAQKLAEKNHIVTIASWDPNPPDWLNISEQIRFVYAPQENLVSFTESLPEADAIVATIWTSAPLVARLPPSKGEKIYLIQGNEPTWAGNADDVEETYTELPLKKLVVSNWLKEILAETYHQDSILVSNGCDFSAINLPSDGSEKNTGIRIGMLYHEGVWKRTQDGLDAFQRVRTIYPHAQLILYGVKRPDQLPVGCNEFYITPTREKLLEILSSLTLFLSPSISEGFGLPALEAMACKIPVVLCDAGGCRDYAIHNETALVSAPKDVNALSANLLRAIENVELQKSLAENGFKKAQEFTWDRSSDQFIKAIRETLNTVHAKLNIVYVSSKFTWGDCILDPMLIRAFQELGHHVTVFDPRPMDWEWEQKFVNVGILGSAPQHEYESGAGHPVWELIDTCEELKPDLVFFNHGLMIPAHILDGLRKKGFPTAAWFLDEPQEMKESVERGRLFDYVFLQDSGSLAYHLENGNSNTYFLPHAIDPTLHHPPLKNEVIPVEYQSDVLIIGTGFPRRRLIMEKLAKLGIKITLIGRMWDGLEAANVTIKPMVTHEEAAKYYQGAKININIHRDPSDFATDDDIPEPKDPNASFFFTSGCGSLQILEKNYPGAEKFLVPSRDFVYFDGADDLAKKIQFYLRHSDVRQQIAQSAVHVIHRYHTYTHRMNELVKRIGHPQSHRRTFGLSKRQPEKTSPIQSILLIAKGSLDFLREALAMIRIHMNDPYELVVVHPEESSKQSYLNEKRIPHVRLPADTNFAEWLNAGIQHTNGEYLTVLTDHVICTGNFSRRLVQMLEKHPDFAIVGPGFNQSPISQTLPVFYTSLQNMSEQANSIYLDNKHHLEEIEFLDNMCFTIRRKAIESIGQCDERFQTARYAIHDVCTRARLNGWKVGWTRSVFIHKRQDAQWVEQPAQTDFDPSVFHEKWNVSINLSKIKKQEADSVAKLPVAVQDNIATIQPVKKPPFNSEDLLRLLLDAEDIVQVLDQYHDFFNEELVVTIKENIKTANQAQQLDLSEGLQYLCEYIETSIREK